VKHHEWIRSYLFENQEQIVADVIRLVEAQSTSARKDLAEACADVLQSLVKERLNAEPEQVYPQQERGRHMFYRIGSGRPKALLLGHYDTVWDPDALPLVREGNRLAGPGAYDMKYGLVGAIWAVKALQEHDLLDFSVGMFFNSDEELGSATSRELVVHYARQFENVLVLEGASGMDVKTARKTLGRYHIDIQGVAAHAGTNYSEGISAVLEAARLTEQIFAMTDLEKGTTLNVGTIQGGTKLNVIAAHAHLGIDLRAVTRKEAQRVHQAIYALKPTQDGITLEISGGITRPPFEATPANMRLYAVAKAAAADLGRELGHCMVGGGSDGNFTSDLGIPTLDGLGAVGDGAHALHEHILIRESLEHTAMLGNLLFKL